MLVPMRNLLLIGAVCWVGPLSAEQRSASGGLPMTSAEAPCPYEDAGGTVDGTLPEVSRAALPIFDVGRRAPGLLP